MTILQNFYHTIFYSLPFWFGFQAMLILFLLSLAFLTGANYIFPGGDRRIASKQSGFKFLNDISIGNDILWLIVFSSYSYPPDCIIIFGTNNCNDKFIQLISSLIHSFTNYICINEQANIIAIRWFIAVRLGPVRSWMFVVWIQYDVSL